MEEDKQVETKNDIKETLELLEALKLLAVTGARIAEDKKVDLNDLKHLVDMAKKMDVLVEGFKGVKDIPTEFKDLNQIEVMEIVAKVFEIVKEVKDTLD